MRIENELRQRGLTEYCIRKGMAEITDDDYELTARSLIQRKWESLNGTKRERSEKTRRYMANKGYEYDLINRILSEFS